jgi:hypothetical protein
LMLSQAVVAVLIVVAWLVPAGSLGRAGVGVPGRVRDGLDVHPVMRQDGNGGVPGLAQLPFPAVPGQRADPGALG